MDPVLAEFLKFTLVGVGAGILVLIVMVVKPKKFKLGNIIEAEFADKEAGTVQLNVDGVKKSYIPGEHVELIVTSVENALGDYIDEKGAYIKKAMQYAETRLKGFAGDIAEAMIKALPPTLTDDEVEERIKLIGLIRRGVIFTIAKFLKESFYNNGFYEMRHCSEGRWYPNPEWGIFIDRQADAITREARHFIGEHLPYSWGMTGRDSLNLLWSVNGKYRQDMEEEYMKSMVEELYLSAWENQHIMKKKKAQYHKQRKEIVDAVRNGRIPL